jgi:hypothetical protein
VPCWVKSWLYCSLDRNCSPGRASFGPHQHGHRTGGQEKPERGHQVQLADLLMVGSAQVCQRLGTDWRARTYRRRPGGDAASWPSSGQAQVQSCGRSRWSGSQFEKIA